MSDQNSIPGKLLWESVVRIGVSLLSGGLFYTGWLGIFLVLYTKDEPIETALWVITPLVTGVGFGFGVYLADMILKRKPSPFLRVAIWPILGCILGAVAVYWYGPMLIVFSMLAAGTASVSLREVIHYRRSLE